jgi:hypothetical protein
MRGVWEAALAAACVVGLAGCSPTVRGIPPILEPVDVSRAADHRRQILDALAADAALSYGQPVPVYSLVEAGFNYIDDRCAEYFSDLFRLNRRREAIKSALSASGQTTSAILSVTDASTLTMAVVAQAFGLSSSLTDIVAGTYLYQLPPSETYEFVKKMLRAHRDGVAAQWQRVTDGNKAYNLIQEHLSLCLPVTIEARLVEHITKAVAAPQTGDSESISVRIGSEVTRLESSVRPLTSSMERLPAVIDRPPQPNALGNFEARMSFGQVAEIQRALCVTPEDGVLGSRTREAVVEFYRGLGQDRRDILQNGIQASETDELGEAVDAAARKTCSQRGITRGAFEVGLGLS